MDFFLQYKEINTARLWLRKPVLSDVQSVFALFSDDEALRFSGAKKHRSVEDSRETLHSLMAGIENSTLAAWAICQKPQQELVGIIAVLYINKEHHFGSFASMLKREYWRQGIMSEAHKAVIGWAFEHTSLNRLESQFYEKHPAVEGMLIKSGMKREGLLRGNFFLNNQFVNSILYSVTRENE